MNVRSGLLGLTLVAFAAQTNATAAKEKISVGINVDPSHVAMVHAIQTGKVKSDVVDLELHLLDINALTQAAATKRFDIMQSAVLAVPRAISQGLQLKILGNTASVPGGPGRDIWVKKDSPLKTPQDLKGKTLGTYSLATGAVTLVRLALWKRYGLNVAVNGGDFTMKQMQISAMPAALATGQLDASMLSNIQAYRAVKSDEFRSIMSSDKITIELFGTNPVSAVFIGYAERLEAKPAAYRAALQLLLDLRNYARANPDEVFNAVAAAERVDAEYLRVWEDQYQGFPVALSEADVGAIDKIWGYAKELGILNIALPAAKDTIWDGVPRREQDGRRLVLRSTALKAGVAHAFTALVLAAWAAAAAFTPPYLVPGPWSVLKDAALFFSDRFHAWHLAVSCIHVLVSLVLSFVVAGTLALVALYWPTTRLLIAGRIYPFLNSFTAVGWTVLAVVWFGSGDATVIFTITTVLVPFVFINLREGLMTLDHEIGEMAESFTRSQWRQFWLIILPSLFPFIFAALRIAFGLAWKVALIAELFGDNSGFGFVIYQARDNIDTKMIFAVILIIIVMVSLMDRFVFAPLHATVTRHYSHG